MTDDELHDQFHRLERRLERLGTMDPEQHVQVIHAIDQLREAMLVQAAAVIYVTMKQPHANDKIVENAFREHPMETSVSLVMGLRKQIRQRICAQGE